MTARPELKLLVRRETHASRRFDFGTLELTLTTVPTLVANLLTLKFTEAAKCLFELRNPKLTLLEDERNLPGREVRYVVAAQRRFGGGA